MILAFLLLMLFVVVFVAFWLLNWPVNSRGLSMRDWWKNRPTWQDPERFNRFMKDRTS